MGCHFLLQGIELRSPALPGRFFTVSATRNAPSYHCRDILKIWILTSWGWGQVCLCALEGGSVRWVGCRWSRNWWSRGHRQQENSHLGWLDYIPFYHPSIKTNSNKNPFRVNNIKDTKIFQAWFGAMFCVFWNKATAFRNCFLGLCCQGQYSRSIEHLMGFPVGSDGKESTCNMGDLGSIPGLGRPSGERHSNPLQYSCLENPMDRGAWKAVVHGVKKIQTQLSD